MLTWQQYVQVRNTFPFLKKIHQTYKSFIWSSRHFTLFSDYGVHPPLPTYTYTHTHAHITSRDPALRQESQGWVGHYGGPWQRLNTNLRSLTLASYIPLWVITWKQNVCMFVCVCGGGAQSGLWKANYLLCQTKYDRSVVLLTNYHSI